jgi:acyl-coenzyme A thioesterase PaaI-like protein
MTDVTEPDLSPLPGWVTLDRVRTRRNRSFVSGDPDGTRLRVRYFRDGPTGPLVARVWFGPDAEGPPGHAHGGAQAAVLDELMGANAWMLGHKVLAGTLQIVYRRPLPLGLVITARAEVPVVEGRKVHTRGLLVDAAGAPFAEGSGVFIIMRDTLQRELFDEAAKLGHATPDAY